MSGVAARPRVTQVVQERRSFPRQLFVDPAVRAYNATVDLQLAVAASGVGDFSAGPDPALERSLDSDLG